MSNESEEPPGTYSMANNRRDDNDFSSPGPDTVTPLPNKAKGRRRSVIDSLLEGMGLVELRSQCDNLGLNSDGDIDDLKERLCNKFSQDTQQENKRRKMSHSTSTTGTSSETHAGTQPSKTGNTMAEEFICPITLELLFNPVTAEDGKLYEQVAIKKHIDGHSLASLKSPMTNEPMGPKLFPNPQVRKVIEQAVDSGDIVGDLAKTWLNMRTCRKKMEGRKVEAMAGNSKSAAYVAHSYQHGKQGLERNAEEALKWWKMAADAGEIDGLAQYGKYLIMSTTMKSDGISMLSEAAGKGSSYACLLLGKFYATGNPVGLLDNDTRAARFLKSGLESHRNAGKSVPNEVQPSTYLVTTCENLLAMVLTRMNPDSSEESQPAA